MKTKGNQVLASVVSRDIGYRIISWVDHDGARSWISWLPWEKAEYHTVHSWYNDEVVRWQPIPGWFYE